VVTELPGAPGQSAGALGCTEALVEGDGGWVLTPCPAGNHR